MSVVERKTNEEIEIEILRNGFTWGKFVKFHKISEYLIVEYKPRVFDGVSPKKPKQHEEVSSFHPYIDGRDTSTSYKSLDKALIGVISEKYDGFSTRAPQYIESMLKMDK